MTAIITANFIEFYYLTKENTELFLDGKWVYEFENVFGREFKDYIFAYNWRDIKDIRSILDYFEAHNIKERKY